MYSMCPTTVVPLHVATLTAKDYGGFPCHGDKPALLLLHLTMHTSSYTPTADLTMNESTSDSMARITASPYNQNINKRQARKLIWPRKSCYGLQILQ